MNRFRRFLAAAMFACLVLCSCGARAQTTDGSHSMNPKQTTGGTLVVLELKQQEASSYTIVIPSRVTLDPTTGKGSLTVTMKKGFVLTDIAKLSIVVDYLTGDHGKPVLIKETNRSEVEYDLTDSEGNAIKHSAEILPVYRTDDNSEDISCTMNLSVFGEIPASGSYSGYINYRIRITPAD